MWGWGYGAVGWLWGHLGGRRGQLVGVCLEREVHAVVVGETVSHLHRLQHEQARWNVPNTRPKVDRTLPLARCVEGLDGPARSW
jgi:hypothetical protein